MRLRGNKLVTTLPSQFSEPPGSFQDGIHKSMNSKRACIADPAYILHIRRTYADQNRVLNVHTESEARDKDTAPDRRYAYRDREET